jgi:hypothetical protein
MVNDAQALLLRLEERKNANDIVVAEIDGRYLLFSDFITLTIVLLQTLFLLVKLCVCIEIAPSNDCSSCQG